MTWMRWLRVLLVGAIAAEATAVTAIGLRWRARVPGAVRLAGYTADGGTLVALSAPTLDQPHTPTVWCWDVETGRGRVAELPDPWVVKDATVAPLGTGRAVLVWENRRIGFGASDPLVRRAYDTATGRPLGPQIVAVPSGVVKSVSADGKIAAVLAHDGSAGIVFVALPGGERVGEVAQSPGVETDAAISPAGDRAVVLRYGEGGTRFALDFVTVPAGDRLRRIDLPAARSWALAGWHGDRVIVTALHSGRDGDWAGQTYQIDPTAASPALDPRLTAARQTKPHWAGLSAPVERPNAGGWRDRVLTALGLGPDVGNEWVSRVVTFRPDGSVAGQYAVRYPVKDLHVAPDGGSAACVRRGRVVELWAADPPSPWPRAVGAGAIAAVGWAWLERRRARR